MALTSRRSFVTGLAAALITAPAIVRAGSLMPVRQMIEPVWCEWWSDPPVEFGGVGGLSAAEIDAAEGTQVTAWGDSMIFEWGIEPNKISAHLKHGITRTIEDLFRQKVLTGR